MTQDIKSRTISSLFWKFLERCGNAVVSLVIQIIMARLLSPEDFGALAIILVFVNVGNVIVSSGLNTSLVQAADADESDFSTVFWLCLSVSVVLYAAVFFAAPAIASFYGSDSLIWPLRVITILLVVNAFNSVQVAAIMRKLAFKKIFVATITSVAISAVIGISAAVNGFGLWALVLQQLSYQVVNCLVLFLQNRWFPRLAFQISLAKKHFSFGWKLLVSGILDTGYQSLSDLIIGKQFSTSDLGLVTQGKRYPSAVGTMLDGTIQPVMFSAVSRVQDDIAQVKSLVRRALKTSTYIIFPSMILFGVVAKPLVVLLLGEKWLPCVPFLQMYCFVYALLPIHTSNLQALNGMGRSDLFLKLEIIKKVIGISIIIFAAIALRDLYLLVGGYMLADVVFTFINAFPNKKVIGYSFREQLRDIAPGVGLTAISAAAVMPIAFLSLPPLGQILLQAILMTAVYIALSVLFRVEEFVYMRTTLREIITDLYSKNN